MAQPSFSPVPATGEVRPIMTTPPAETGRLHKAGLLRHVPRGEAGLYGTPGPGEGFALTLAAREVEKMTFESHHDAAAVSLAVGLVAAKRASLLGRGPTRGDVLRALAVLGLSSPVTTASARPFSGLRESYVAQRRLVDGVRAEDLIDADGR